MTYLRIKKKRQLSLVEQEMLTLTEHFNSPLPLSGGSDANLTEHFSSPLPLSGGSDAQSLVFCVVFCRSLFRV